MFYSGQNNEQVDSRIKWAMKRNLQNNNYYKYPIKGPVQLMELIPMCMKGPETNIRLRLTHLIISIKLYKEKVANPPPTNNLLNEIF